MDAESGYDTTNFHELQSQLKRLNDLALASGLIAPRDGWFETFGAADTPQARKAKAEPKQGSTPDRAVPGRPPREAKSGVKAVSGAARPAKGRRSTEGDGAESGKAGAQRLLKMLRRVAGDDSPPVPGTDFTESGVVRLLAHLRKPRSRQFRFLQRLRRFLTLPVAMGMHTSAGVSVERLQVVSHRLNEIETFGWTQFKSIRAARRAKRAPPTSKYSPPALTELR